MPLAGLIPMIMSMLGGLGASKLASSLGGAALKKLPGLTGLGAKAASSVPGVAADAALGGLRGALPKFAQRAVPTVAGGIGGLGALGATIGSFGAFDAGMRGTDALFGSQEPDLNQWEELMGQMPRQVQERQALSGYQQQEMMRQFMESLTPERIV